MLDQEIEDVIVKAMERHNKILLQSYRTDNSGNGITSYWAPQSNTWGYNSPLDPLSCVLITLNPEPHKLGYEDIAMATLCQMFDRQLGWIRSFQCGWYGEDNQSESIGGYILGRKINKLYFPKT